MEDWKWCLTIRICLSKTNMASGDKRGLKLWKTKLKRGMGRFPFTKKFRKFRLGCKWNHLKISGKNGILEKVVPFSRWKLPNGNLCSICSFLVFITSSMPFAVFQAAKRLSCFNKNGGWSEAFCKQTFRGYYECSACQVIAPDLENLLQHECAVCKSSR